MSLFALVEGDGDRHALPPLVTKLALFAGIEGLPHIPREGVSTYPLNADRNRGQGRVLDRCELYRARPRVSALLLTQDADDACPKNWAPTIAGWIRPLQLPFPVAVVLFYREYETMFLAASQSLQGQPLQGQVQRAGLPAGAVFQGNPETPRSAKGWIREQLGRPYVETIDQEAFTRTLDMADGRLGQLSSFRRLRQALAFLAEHASSVTRGMVYP
jgi:hypothetical protein